MTHPRTDDVAREGLDALRATSDARERVPSPALVEVAGGEPIVYDDEPEGTKHAV